MCVEMVENVPCRPNCIFFCFIGTSTFIPFTYTFLLVQVYLCEISVRKEEHAIFFTCSETLLPNSHKPIWIERILLDLQLLARRKGKV
jgi:hypothetical protein